MMRQSLAATHEHSSRFTQASVAPSVLVSTAASADAQIGQAHGSLGLGTMPPTHAMAGHATGGHATTSDCPPSTATQVGQPQSGVTSTWPGPHRGYAHGRARHASAAASLTMPASGPAQRGQPQGSGFGISPYRQPMAGQATRVAQVVVPPAPLPPRPPGAVLPPALLPPRPPTTVLPPDAVVLLPPRPPRVVPPPAFAPPRPPRTVLPPALVVPPAAIPPEPWMTPPDPHAPPAASTPPAPAPPDPGAPPDALDCPNRPPVPGP